MLDNITEKATRILKKVYGNNASFREGQLEAINATFDNKRTLIVQKTGWGKSIVYFISTKINRELGKGVTLVISPLTVLITNQIEAAKMYGLECRRISYENKDEHNTIFYDLFDDKIDILFITPESLFSRLLPYVNKIKIGMFVIDEAHCISDWGHDFRLEYRKIVDVLKELKDTKFPILATTATADQHVIDDLKNQIGPNLYVSRGSLYRDNLYLQTIDLKNKVNKYAWILQHINDLKGTGIIYCLTTRDCESLSNFLNANGISTKSYHSKLDNEIANNNLNLFIQNKIKALVATIKLGMGYDKPDVSFIIHYQFPKNIVSYYQQIGRAARNIEAGYAILLRGGNDSKILDNFINNSFPDEISMKKILDEFNKLGWNDKNYLTSNDLRKRINMSGHKIELALKFLENENYIIADAKKHFSKTTKKFVYNGEHYNEIKEMKKKEIKALDEIFVTKKCLNLFVVNSLDSNEKIKCNKCPNCLNKDIINVDIDEKNIQIAKSFIYDYIIEIIPKHKDYRIWNQITKKWELINTMKNGIALSKYGEEGIGEIVRECKYSKPPKSYPEAIYTKTIRCVYPLIKEYNIEYITFVPSLNNNLMDEFAEKLAKKLSLKFIKCFRKKENIEQKTMLNASHQMENANNNYDLIINDLSQKNIIVFDDVVDSGYTFSCLGKKLMKAGAGNVVPVALTDAGERGNENE